MSQEFHALRTSIERLMAEHTRLRVENQALSQRTRELEEKLAINSERVRQARARLNSLVAQLPLDMQAQTGEPTPAANQTSLL